MVFWSSFSKKIKQAVSQISFDALKKRVDTIETTYATKTYTDTQNQAQDTKINANTTNITTNTNSITTLDTKVDGVINGLQNGNIINYIGPFDAAKTYSIAQAITYNDKWYVSNVNNNVGHTPSGTSDQYWELLSEPTINLNPYLTKTEAATTYINKTEAANQFIVKTMLNTMFPVGSIVMTADNSVHKLVQMYPSKFQELTDTDVSFLGFGNGSAGLGNDIAFNINQNNLPNVSYSLDWNIFTKDASTSITAASNPNNLLTGIYNIEVKKTYNYQNYHTDAAVNKVGYTFQLNGGVNPVPVHLTIKPKTLKVRVWKVISDLV